MNSNIDHSARAHALLSASGANRWLACTPSARLEEKYGEKTSSAFTEEGTVAHELAELMLRLELIGDISKAEYEEKFRRMAESEYLNESMVDYLYAYISYCREQFAAARANDMFSEIHVEKKLDLREYIPEGFGTCDCIIIGNGTLEVIDLKYGKGVQVSAEWNKQLMLYGLGALVAYDTEFEFDTVQFTIVQPRLNNISSFSLSVTELLDWAENELKPKARLAFEGAGELVAGVHCKFCSVKNRCRKLYEQQLEIAAYDFREPEFLTDQEIADIISRATVFTEWISGIVAYAEKKAINEGKVWPGFKLVEGISRRTWFKPDDEIIQAIRERFPEIPEDMLYDVKLKSLTNIEKLVGAKSFATKLSDLVIKPAGKPTLVPEADRRPAIGLASAVKDFE